MSASQTNHEPLLAIDTAGPRLQLALSLNGKIDVLVEELAKGHAEIIFERIAQLLARNGCTYAGLTRVAVTTGPGSFTGLRIGLSAARGLGLSLDIPVVGVPVLLAMSLAAPRGKPVAILRDARRDQSYVQNFSAPGVSVSKPMVLPTEEAHAKIAKGTLCLEPDRVDIALLTAFATNANAADFPPTPCYVRAADAKPQTKAKVARVGASAP